SAAGASLSSGAGVGDVPAVDALALAPDDLPLPLKRAKPVPDVQRKVPHRRRAVPVQGPAELGGCRALLTGRPVECAKEPFLADARRVGRAQRIGAVDTAERALRPAVGTRLGPPSALELRHHPLERGGGLDGLPEP